MSWLEFLPAGFELAFWTILVGALSNASCAILGCYLVLRRLSLLGDAISHAILPGIALAFLIGGTTASLPMFAGAMAMGILTALLTQTLHRFGKVPEDASMGVVFTSLFALGVILITRIAPDVHLDAGCVLYGLIEFVSTDTMPVFGWEIPRALPPLGLTLGATLAFVALFWKELKIVSFDPLLATAMGLNATLVHYLLMAMVAGVTVAAFEAVGSILVVAMLIVPAATAHLLTDRLGWMMFWAVVVAVLSAVLGYLADAYWDTGVAGMMAVAAGAQFALAVFFAPRHGLVSKAFHNLALGLRIVSEDVVAMLYRSQEAGGQARGPAGTSWQACAATGGGGWAGWLAVPRLWLRGDLWFAPGWRLQLTGQGRRSAQSLVRSHRLWESYLGEHFQLPLDHLHEAAERIEHYIGPDLQERLATELARPGLDPHGRPIPPARDEESQVARE